VKHIKPSDDDIVVKLKSSKDDSADPKDKNFLVEDNETARKTGNKSAIKAEDDLNEIKYQLLPIGRSLFDDNSKLAKQLKENPPKFMQKEDFGMKFKFTGK
jgi:hypothetical protein